MEVFKILILPVFIANVFGIPVKDDFINVQDQQWERTYNQTHNQNGPVVGQIFEGDVRITQTDVDFLSGKVKSDAIIGSRYVWPDKKVPYVISGLNTAGRRALTLAIAEYTAKTCVRFIPRTNQRDYVQFFPGGGCYSNVGRAGGMQRISLGRGCEYKSTAVHEMMHALGFWHEQSRQDRDNFIRIIKANINPRMFYNFNKHVSTTYGEPYDYVSVMHYSNRAFTSNGRQTIQALNDPTRNFGQPINGGLSRIDRNQVNKHYKCAGTEVVTTTTKKPTTNDCVDKQPFCTLIRSYCTSNNWVKDNCKKSCSTGADKSVNCPRWARAGYCTRTYVSYMRRNCPASCNIGGCSK